LAAFDQAMTPNELRAPAVGGRIGDGGWIGEKPRELDGAFGVRIGIDDAGGFQRIDDAKRPVEPARVILAFEMRPGQ